MKKLRIKVKMWTKVGKKWRSELKWVMNESQEWMSEQKWRFERKWKDELNWMKLKGMKECRNELK